MAFDTRERNKGHVDMIEVTIKQDMVNRAILRSRKMGSIRNSITSGQGNIAGFIGEEVVNEYIGGKIVDHYDYDLIVGHRLVDVKTKRCTSRPKGYYDCSIASTSTHQKCTEYIFVRIEWHKSKPNDWKRAWICGRIDRDEYFRKGRKLLKGQLDGSNKFVVKADCYNLRIEQLEDVLV